MTIFTNAEGIIQSGNPSRRILLYELVVRIRTVFWHGIVTIWLNYKQSEIEESDKIIRTVFWHSYHLAESKAI